MKKYIKNKNFIPKKFYNIQFKKEINNIKRIEFLFLILNLILLPITLKNIYDYRENKYRSINYINNEYKVEEMGINFNDIVCWINNIFLDEVENASIDKNGGEIKINNINALKKINDSINIKNINNDNVNYILGVELNNEKR
ncbi:hypothetical protein [Clostridium taeniosporum]|uniref:Uncharacterized protein n=1 Tax=Clostridium taeniosporum TaxID=394958 RepID=A0A1D7XKR1_9CLOT|nr:hypothetical protein [Clostridium taeniosporum]AOR23921.1 hypothetical protein BGI42_09365 [Clostridium taeniosporum]